tara:strand:+ start:1735 stop:2745 length:1011 start_codon:yes stop_codon:yes gene_type:complete
MQDPLVSIIVPTYNRLHRLPETLNSVFAQTHKNLECLVVDDGSTDDTFAFLANLAGTETRIRFFRRPADRLKGANACRNFGFEQSEGEYILFLDSDDVLAPTCIEERLQYLRDENADFVVANTSSFVNKTFLDKVVNIDPVVNAPDKYLSLFLSYQLPWTIMSSLWKREVVKTIAFDEELKRFQDVDFHIRVLLNGSFKFKRLKKIDNYYRWSGKTKQNNKEFNRAVADSFLELLRKLTKTEELSPQHYDALKRFIYVISKDFIYFTEDIDLDYARAFNKEIKQFDFFDLKDRSIFKVMWIYSKFGMYGKGGTGGYRFSKRADAYYDSLSIAHIND